MVGFLSMSVTLILATRINDEKTRGQLDSLYQNSTKLDPVS